MAGSVKKFVPKNPIQKVLNQMGVSRETANRLLMDLKAGKELSGQQAEIVEKLGIAGNHLPPPKSTVRNFDKTIKAVPDEPLVPKPSKVDPELEAIYGDRGDRIMQVQDAIDTLNKPAMADEVTQVLGKKPTKTADQVRADFIQMRSMMDDITDTATKMGVFDKTKKMLSGK
jgi:hypothetical protein